MAAWTVRTSRSRPMPRRWGPSSDVRSDRSRRTRRETSDSREASRTSRASGISFDAARDRFILHGPMRTDDRRRGPAARCGQVAGWGSQDIPSGSYPGTPRSPVRRPEIDGSKGPAGCASGPERPSPAIDRGPRAAAFRWGLGFSFRHLRGYPCIRVTKIFLSIPGWLDSDSQVATFIVDGPGGPTLGRLSMDRVKTGIIGLDTMLNGGFLPARPYLVSRPTGSGKTVLAAHFLLEGLRQQEPCLLVTLDQPPIQGKANMAPFGWNMDRLKILDANPDVRAPKRQRSVIDVGTSLDVRDMEDVTEIRQSSQIRA